MSKIGIVLASTVGIAMLAVTGCATQQSGAATPANLPNNCKVVTSNSCKGMSACKQAVHSCKAKHRHHQEDVKSNN